MNAPLQPRERTLTLPHLQLTAQVWGEDGLPPLLAVHGWLDNAGSFARLGPLLATRFQVIALDLPGHGHAQHLPPGMGYHYGDHVRTLLEVLDALGTERVRVLGHSLGAGISSLVAAAAPARIERLWLIEGLGPLADDGSHTLERWRKALVPRPERRRPLRLFTSIEQAVAARSAASGLAADLARPIVERGLLAVDGGWRWRSDPRLTQPSASRLAESQVRSLLAGIDTPTALLLAQPESPYLPGAQLRERAACVPDIAVSWMAGCHHLHLEHPQAVADWIVHGMTCA
ncbi:MAG: alpha/beta fold hydrolase [Xanthomonadales bacterium]|nr:alpha/beta fold hydrolase [Xanthomonadales bacterium]